MNIWKPRLRTKDASHRSYARTTSEHMAIAYVGSLFLWLLFIGLIVLQRFIVKLESGEPLVSNDIIVTFARSATAALICPLLYVFVLRQPFDIRKPLRSALYYLGLLVFFYVGFCGIRWLIYPTYDWVAHLWYPRSLETFVALFKGFQDMLMIFGLTVGCAHAIGWYLKTHWQELEKIDLRRALSEAQLEALSKQLRPHFLFNTLNGISGLIPQDPAKGRTLLLRLSELLQAAIHLQATDLVPFNAELALAHGYLELEQLRLGKRLTVEWNICSLSTDVAVPHLILQPLIENAIVHGAAANKEGGWIKITSAQIQDKLRIEITNSIAPVASSARRNGRGNGIGLSNTQARLKTLFSGHAILQFQTEGAIATTMLLLPIKESR